MNDRDGDQADKLFEFDGEIPSQGMVYSRFKMTKTRSPAMDSPGPPGPKVRPKLIGEDRGTLERCHACDESRH